MSRGRQELALLHVDRLCRCLRRRDEQVGLAAEKRRNLQDVDDLRRRRRVRRLVNVGQHRQPGARLDLGERREARVETRTAKRRQRRAIGLVVRRLEDQRHIRARAAISRSCERGLDGVRLALDHARARR